MDDLTDTGPHAWAQQPGEPDKQYGRFLDWLALPDRRMDRAADVLRLSHSYLRRVAADWGWTARAIAWDTEQAQQSLADRVDSRAGVLADLTEAARLRSSAVLKVMTLINNKAESLLQAPIEKVQTADVMRMATALRSAHPVIPDGTAEDDSYDLRAAVDDAVARFDEFFPPAGAVDDGADDEAA